jgi:hypothetical protein
MRRLYCRARPRGSAARRTPAEAAEAIGVTFLMNGGPATVYGAWAFAAFQEFYAELAEQPDGKQPRGPYAAAR